MVITLLRQNSCVLRWSLVLWIGADPGGHENFGIAIIDSYGNAQSRTVSSALEASEWIEGKAAAVGIDAPLWWSAAESGWRKADRFLRERYGLSSGTVQSANSLRGAVLVQGALFAELVRAKNQSIGITESHPKELRKALKFSSADDIFLSFRVSAAPRNAHERDAIIGAICAREGFSAKWARNLAVDRYDEEQNPFEYWLKPVNYWWADI